MPQKHHTMELIVANLHKANVKLGKAKQVPGICILLDIVAKSTRTELILLANRFLPSPPPQLIG